MRTLQELNSDPNNENGEIVDINNYSNKQLVNFFLKSHDNLSTLSHYGRYLRFFLEFIDDFPVRDVKQYHMVQFIKEREKDVGKLQKTTIKSYLTCISSFFNYIKENDYEMGKNPAPAAMKEIASKAISVQYEPLKIEEVKTILHNTVPPRERAIILMLFKTGCRISEIQSLQLEDVDLNNNIITVRNRKHHKNTNKISKIPIDAELSLVLQNWLIFRPKSKSGNLFLSYYGTSLTTTRMREIVLTCGKNAGIMKANSHRYRYTFTTTLIQNNVNENIVGELRGDSDRSMVRYYTKLDFETDIRPAYLSGMPFIL